MDPENYKLCSYE
jgi:4-hydroxysphinganine ceramide fatty acyl 2-hydroxylase